MATQTGKSAVRGLRIGPLQDNASVLPLAEFDLTAGHYAKQVTDRLWNRDPSF